MIPITATVLTYTSVEDTAGNLATNTGSYVAAGKNVTVSGAATIAQLTTIDGDNGNGSLTYQTITDAIGNLYANGSVNAKVVSGVDVNVTGAGTTFNQLAAIDTQSGGGTVTTAAVTGDADDLATNAAGFVAAGVDVTVSDAATIAQLTTINANNGNGTTTPLFLTPPATSPPTLVPTLRLARTSPSLMQAPSLS